MSHFNKGYGEHMIREEPSKQANIVGSVETGQCIWIYENIETTSNGELWGNIMWDNQYNQKNYIEASKKKHWICLECIEDGEKKKLFKRCENNAIPLFSTLPKGNKFHNVRRDYTLSAEIIGQIPSGYFCV
jgi:hypothetical protein